MLLTAVGLTTPQVQDFAKQLAQLGGAHLTDAELTDYARDKTQTKQIKLERPVPVELRCETLVVEDGKLPSIATYTIRNEH